MIFFTAYLPMARELGAMVSPLVLLENKEQVDTNSSKFQIKHRISLWHFTKDNSDDKSTSHTSHTHQTPHIWIRLNETLHQHGLTMCSVLSHSQDIGPNRKASLIEAEACGGETYQGGEGTDNGPVAEKTHLDSMPLGRPDVRVKAGHVHVPF